MHASRMPVGARYQVAGILGAALVLSSCVAGNEVGPGTPEPLQIITLTNRADLVSDGNALTEIVLPDGADTTELEIRLNGKDVSEAFSLGPDGRVKGLLVDLQDGENEVTATLPEHTGSRLKVTNAPRSGPVFSGPFPAPAYHCATPEPQPASGPSPATNASGLSGQPDAYCNAPTEFKLYYRTTDQACVPGPPEPPYIVPPMATTVPEPVAPPDNPCFKPYDPAAAAPQDLALTTTDAGFTVPYIVRVERGVMNRGIYDIAVLYDPEQPWTATSVQMQWNGKLFYQFGPGTSNPHRQYPPALSWTHHDALSRGFAVVQNSMSDSGTNGNRVLAAETVMMMVEHIGDSYGEIRYSIGTGCSGGAIISHQIMSLTPGLLDGFIIECSLMDTETAVLEAYDCVLLVEAYQKAPWLALMAEGTEDGPYSRQQVDAIQAAINGHRDPSQCYGWAGVIGSGAGNAQPGNYFPRVVMPEDVDTGAITQLPVAQNNCQLPADLVYDAETNRDGIRCSMWDWSRPVYGRAAKGSYTRDVRDNTGVQYGLQALLDDRIPAEAFVTINEIVGGFDKDSNLTADRMVADAEALEIAYRAGLVVSGTSMSMYPQIDLRSYDDSLTDAMPGAVVTGAHPIWRSYSLRDRLDRDAGGHGNHVMWRYGRTGLATPPWLLTEALEVMDAWLAGLETVSQDVPVSEQIIAAKPEDAVDFCLLSSDESQSVKVMDEAVCDADPYLTPSASPRQVAGSPRTEDILKCRLKPLSRADYGGRLTDFQFERLESVFETGVCDWSRPGIGQQPQHDGWLTFHTGPGGQPLGPRPQSSPLQAKP